MAPNPFITFPLKGIHITENLLWAILGVFFIFYCIIGVVLLFHWREYGLGSKAVVFAELIFIAVSVILFLAASAIVITF